MNIKSKTYSYNHFNSHYSHFKSFYYSCHLNIIMYLIAMKMNFLYLIDCIDEQIVSQKFKKFSQKMKGKKAYSPKDFFFFSF